MADKIAIGKVYRLNSGGAAMTAMCHDGDNGWKFAWTDDDDCANVLWAPAECMVEVERRNAYGDPVEG